MNRFGKILLGLLLLGVIGLISIVRIVPADAPGDSSRDTEPAAADDVVVAPTGLAIPVAGVRAADLTDTFGDARGEERRHGALDIMAPAGRPVIAAAGGTVEKLFTSEAGGLTVYVRSPDRRFSYYYAHLRDYAADLREGIYVPRGRRLGSVGSTGNASPDGPHLHFAIFAKPPDAAWHEGRPIDPYRLLAGQAPAR
ncbi:M23 family metallopeptidase [Sphingomonas sp. 1P06PA]|uniref:M23 family metallopeptidase n=1 Tax=Sphingomonas sp. 1P06PA TaxID=554121 RepID=UPI0039A56172